MKQQILDELSTQKAAFLEKFVTVVLERASAYWAEQTRKHPLGSKQYTNAFHEWHRLQQDKNAVELEIRLKNNRIPNMPLEDDSDDE